MTHAAVTGPAFVASIAYVDPGAPMPADPSRANAAVTAGGTPEQIHLGAQIMYYGGNLIEVMLATMLMTTWYTRSGRAARHQRRPHAARTAPPPKRGKHSQSMDPSRPTNAADCVSPSKPYSSTGNAIASYPRLVRPK